MFGFSTEQTEDAKYINNLITAACLVITKGTKHRSIHKYLFSSFLRLHIEAVPYRPLHAHTDQVHER
jgi:hypothetical protein